MTHWTPITVVLSLLTTLLPLPAVGQTPGCARLAGAQKALAKRLLASRHVHDCCDETLATCLKAKRVCRLAYRLAENICKRVAAGQGEKQIISALERRAKGMTQLRPHAVSLKGVPVVGDARAKVSLVMYACGRCPFCAKISPRLHGEVVAGRLKGKVRLYFKTFPLRTHPGAKEIGLAFVAAARLGRFWPFLLHAYKHADSFSTERIPAWAAAVGLDGAKMQELMRDKTVRKQLVGFKKEGLRNGVKATPTFLINGRTYHGEPKLDELVDVLEEQWERKMGLSYR